MLLGLVLTVLLLLCGTGLQGNGLCNPPPKTQEIQIHENSTLNVLLAWPFEFEVELIRICIRLPYQKDNENGLCPKGEKPLLTVPTQEPNGVKFLGSQSDKELFDRIKHYLQITPMNLRFLFNVTDKDNGITFRLLVRPKNSTLADCYNLPSFHLVRDFTPKPILPTTIQTITQESRNTTTNYTTTQEMPTESNEGGKIAGIVSGIIAGGLFVIVLVRIIIKYRNGNQGRPTVIINKDHAQFLP